MYQQPYIPQQPLLNASPFGSPFGFSSPYGVQTSFAPYGQNLASPQIFGPSNGQINGQSGGFGFAPQNHGFWPNPFVARPFNFSPFFAPAVPAFQQGLFQGNGTQLPFFPFGQNQFDPIMSQYAPFARNVEAGFFGQSFPTNFPLNPFGVSGTPFPQAGVPLPYLAQAQQPFVAPHQQSGQPTYGVSGIGSCATQPGVH